MISVVISYCSLDNRFIMPLIQQVKKFTDDIIVTSFDHLLNGKPDKYILSIPGVKQAILPFDASRSTLYLHSLLRYKGAEFAKNDWVLFLDADEIIEGERFYRFIQAKIPLNFDAVTFESFWYFRSPLYQALTIELTSMLVNKKFITEKRHFGDGERWAYLKNNELRRVSPIRDEHGPMLHHFSWVRTKEEMLDKVTGWGHKRDKDWVSIVNEEFSRDFNGTDFVHGYTYQIVENKFNL